MGPARGGAAVGGALVGVGAGGPAPPEGGRGGRHAPESGGDPAVTVWGSRGVGERLYPRLEGICNAVC